MSKETGRWRPWRPRPASGPSRWQLEQAAGVMRAECQALAEALGRVLNAAVAVRDVRVVDREPGSEFVALGSRLLIERGLAVEVLSRLLGFRRAAEFRLEEPAERAVLEVVAQRLAAAAAEEGDGEGPATWVLVSVGSADGIGGRIAVRVNWGRLWARAQKRLAETAPRPRIPYDRTVVDAMLWLPGPAVELATLLGLKRGDVLGLPSGAQFRAKLVVNGVEVAAGRLGAVRGRKALRVERLLSGGGQERERQAK